MGLIQKLLGKTSEDKVEFKRKFKEAQEEQKINRLLEERSLSSNERELNQLRNEEREEHVKEELDFRRKQRDDDIRFGHNPLDTPNITSHVEWEVLKERNMFQNNNNMFEGQKSVLKNNKNLMKTNKKLLKGGNLFKI